MKYLSITAEFSKFDVEACLYLQKFADDCSGNQNIGMVLAVYFIYYLII